MELPDSVSGSAGDLRVILGADVSPFMQAISGAQAAIAALDLKPPPVVVSLDLAPLMADIQRAKAALRDLADEARAINLGGGAGGSGGTGGRDSRRVSDARAEGGPVYAGRSYLVGECGPEIFTTAQSGQIIPNLAAPTQLASRPIQIGAVNLYGVQDANALLAALEDTARRRNRQLLR